MLAADIGAGGRDAASLRADRLDDLALVERIADADRPGFAGGVLAAGLDVAAGVDEEIPDAGGANEIGGVADGPALDDAGRIERPVGPADVEIAVRLALRPLGERQHLAHLAR